VLASANQRPPELFPHAEACAHTPFLHLARFRKRPPPRRIQVTKAYSVPHL
jgi:hypothetical protein